MEFKGTKGKWHLSEPKFIGRWQGFNTQKGTCYGIYSTSDDLEAIALVPKDYVLHDKDQNNKANALLISKAPEMLEMLQLLINEFEYDNATEYQCNLIFKTKQLIKEATELK